jgi:NADH-quinone oxidoreductase subunit M
LLLPFAAEWALEFLALAGVVTAVYAAGLALVQRDPRRFFCYLFLSHSALVLVGLETVTPEALTGGLCVWFAASLSLAGFGLTLRSVESRMGRLSLAEFHGLYEHMPSLAALFLLTGLASVGFPGTIGFVATELLIDGVIQHYPFFGFALVGASALNGIAILGVYFRLFTGKRHRSSISLQARLAERVAVLSLIAIMVGGGVFPQPFLASRLHAAGKLIELRQLQAPSSNPSPPHAFIDSSPRPSERETEPEESKSLPLLRADDGARLTARQVAVTRLSESDGSRGRRNSQRRRPRIRDATSDH